MRDPTKQCVLQVIRDHPAIKAAAVTGSLARPTGGDRFSDLDVLLVARDFKQVSEVRVWLPDSLGVLICSFHLSHYCTVLLEDFQKIDFAIFATDEPSSKWVIHDYEIVKNSDGFTAQLAEAAKRTREKAAAHLNPDVCLDNVLLLLVTASQRVARGELLSAHSFLALACDMMITMEMRPPGPDSAADLLDPRRRLEQLRPERAATIHECLFAPPAIGITRLARDLATAHRAEFSGPHSKVLDYLAKSTDR